MSKEIERKYLFKGTPYDLLVLLNNVQPLRIEDYYLNENSRIRRIPGEEPVAYMCVKGKGTLVRDEWEYKLNDYPDYRGLPGVPLVKNRYKVFAENKWYEINVYRDLPVILVECEVEIKEDTTDKFEVYFTGKLPKWVGREVTKDKNFYNYELWKTVQAKIKEEEVN